MLICQYYSHKVPYTDLVDHRITNYQCLPFYLCTWQNIGQETDFCLFFLAILFIGIDYEPYMDNVSNDIKIKGPDKS